MWHLLEAYLPLGTLPALGAFLLALLVVVSVSVVSDGAEQLARETMPPDAGLVAADPAPSLSSSRALV